MPRCRRQGPASAPNSTRIFDRDPMNSPTLDTNIKVTWPDGHRSYSPGTTEELFIIAADLLLQDLGHEAARTFVDQVFERHWPATEHQPTPITAIEQDAR